MPLFSFSKAAAKLLLFFIATCISNQLLAQNTEVDHLRATMKGDLPLEEQIEAALALALSTQDKDEAFDVAYEAVELSAKLKKVEITAKAYATLGKLYYSVESNYDLGKYYFDLALSLLDDQEHFLLIASINEWYVSMLYNWDRHAEAIERNLANLKHYEKAGNRKYMASTYNRIANSNNYLGYHDVAMKYYGLSLDMYTELDDHDGMGKVFGNMAIIYGEEKEFPQAYEHYKLSILHYGLAGSEVNQAHSYVNLGMDFTDQRMVDSAELYLGQAYKIFLKHPEAELDMGFCLQSLGKMYMAKEDYPKAEKYFKEALAVGYKLGNTQLIINNHEYVSDVYMQKGDFENAYKNYRISDKISDSLFTLSNTRLIAEMQSKYENERQATENEHLKTKATLNEATIQKQKIFNASFAIILSIVLISGGVLYSAYKKILNQKKLAEQANELIVEQSEKLKKNDKIKSQFFSNISHELRTPLTIMMGMLEQLTQKAQEKLDDQELKKLATAKANGMKIQQLIDEVFELTKIDAHKLKLTTKPETILPLMERIVFSFHSLAEQKNQDIKISYSQVHDILLEIDASKFEKIINNLIINAIKFTPEGGSITVDLRLQDKSDVLEISVIDNGAGISEADIGHIFNRYYQSESHDQQANPGTGLGLAMAKQLTELHGGQINVMSTLGQGTIFTLRFPVYKAPTVKSSSHSGGTEYLSHIFEEDTQNLFPHDQEKIMLVEDNPDMREYLKDIFGNTYKLIFCANGEEALLALKSNVPHLIITDLMMPKMDGNTLLKHIKNDPKWQAIPVIILTAKIGEEEKISALRLGVDDYITKPFNAQEMLIKVKNLIKNSQSRIEWLKEEEPNGVANHQDDKFLNTMTHFVKDNIKNTSVNISDLADHMNMSERQLYRKIGVHTGLTPNQLIREIKLRHAHDLIKKKSITKVAALAREVGFESAPYFAKLYFERFGKKPSDYWEEVS